MPSPSNEKATPGQGSGTLEGLTATTPILAEPLPSLDDFPGPAEVGEMPADKRRAYLHGIRAGIVATQGSATDYGYRHGYDNGFKDGYQQGHGDGRTEATRDHLDALDRQAKQAAARYADAVPYWELCRRRGEPERAAQARKRATERGYAI